MITDSTKKLLLFGSVALIDAKRDRSEERQTTSVDYPLEDFIGFLTNLQITPTNLFSIETFYLVLYYGLICHGFHVAGSSG